jgi:ankyrin repeat protein/WD40 repeat protein
MRTSLFVLVLIVQIKTWAQEPTILKPHITRSWFLVGELFQKLAEAEYHDCNWASGLLFHKMASNHFVENDGANNRVNEAVNKFIPEMAIVSRSNPVTAIAFSPDGNYLASASGNTVQLLNLNTMKTDRVLRGPLNDVESLAFNRKGDMLAAYSKDNCLRFWDVKTATEKSRLRKYLYGIKQHVEFDTYADFYAYALGNQIYFNRLESNKEIVTVQEHKNIITAFSYCHSKKILASSSLASKGRGIFLDDLSQMSRREIKGLGNLAGQVSVVMLCENGNYLAYTTLRNAIYLYDLENQTDIKVFEEKGKAGKYAFSPNGRYFVYAYTGSRANENALYVFDITNNARVAKICNFGLSQVSSIAFAGNNLWFAASTNTGNIHLFTMETSSADRSVAKLDTLLDAGVPYNLSVHGEYQYKNLDTLLMFRSQIAKNKAFEWLPEAVSNMLPANLARYNKTSSGSYRVSDLMYFAFHKQADSVKLLIEKGAKVNERTDDGLTALIWAIARPDNDLVVNLISKQLSVEEKEQDLFFSIENNYNLKMIESLLGLGLSVNCETDLGETPLIVAARVKNTALMKWLVSKGADINAKTKYSQSALYEALHASNPEGAAYLLGLGAQINNQSALNGETELIVATRYFMVDIVTKLCEMGANLDVQDSNGWSALHYAAYFGYDQLVELLVAKGANINNRQDGTNRAFDGNTPLMLATNQNNVETVKLLIRLGANVNLSTAYEWTPLLVASYNGSTDIIELLLGNQAKPTFTSLYGNKQGLVSVAETAKQQKVLDLLKSRNITDIKRYQIPHHLKMHGYEVNHAGKNHGKVTAELTSINDSIYSLVIDNDDINLFGIFRGTGRKVFHTDELLVINFDGAYYQNGRNDVFIAGQNTKTSVCLSFSKKGISGFYYIPRNSVHDYEQFGTITLKQQK